VHPEQGDVVLQIRKSKAELGSLAGRLEGTVAGHRPTLVCLRPDSSPEPIVLKVARETGAFAAENLSPGSYKVRAWIPGMGIWAVGKVEILPGERAEIVKPVPAPGFVEVRVEIPETARREDVEVLLWSGAFSGLKSKGGSRKLRETAEHVFTTDAFPANYYLESFPRGDRLRDPSSLPPRDGRDRPRDVRPAWLRPQDPPHRSSRNLVEGESVTLAIQGSSGERRTLVAAASLRNNRSMKLRVCVPSDAQELRVETSSGLSGRLAITESQLVQDAALNVRLESPTRR
jgi:hypothetical protein